MVVWLPVAAIDDVAAGSGHLVHIEGQPIALLRYGDDIYAIDDRCSHADVSLVAGQVQGRAIECPMHGARFDLRTGAALCLPATVPIRTYRVRIEGTAILLAWESRLA